MRRELVIFAIIILAVLVVGFFFRFFPHNFAVNQLKGAFPGYDVSVESAEFRNASMIAISNIDIRNGKALCYRIRSLEINFTPASIFTRTISKVAVKDGNIQVVSPKENLKDLVKYPALKSGGGFKVKSVVISNLMVVLNTADWKINTTVDGNIEMGKTITYSAKIRAGEIDLSALPKGLNAEKRVGLEGLMSGSLAFRGENMNIAEIKGEFLVAEPGGSLVISDKELLKKLADNTKQPLSFIEDNFKNYGFTKGTLGISRNADSILFHIVLDGAKGKRNLTVALHGF